MSRICLDTSAYTHYKRGEPEVTHVIADAYRLFVPAVVLGELRAGFRAGRDAAHHESELGEFLDHPLVTVMDVDDRAASHFADLVGALREAGTPVPTHDIWIAALAARDGATVVTYDRRFERFPSIGTIVLRAVGRG